MSQSKALRLVGGGGGKPPTRTNTADNLFSRDKVELVLALGEGPILGLVTPEGLDPLPAPVSPSTYDFRSFFVGDVPLKRFKSGAEPAVANFQDLSAEFFPGSGDGETVTLTFGGQSNNTEVGVTCTKQEPLRRLTPPELRGRVKKIEVRLAVTQLYIENDSGTFNNDLFFNIEYKKSRAPDVTYTKVISLDLQPVNGLPYWDSVSQRLRITGKTSSGWAHDFVITLPTVDPDPTDDWEIRVTKISPDYDPAETHTKHLAEFQWQSFQSITGGATLTHSNLAMVRVSGKSSDQFNSIPQFTSIVKGLIVKVPNNYNPDMIGLGAFSPIAWNGETLKDSWTNNNALVLYDLATNPRYGLAAHSPSLTVNKADIYAAALYCNESVATRSGEVQKRYTFTAELREVQGGFSTLEYVAGSFDAVIFDDGNGSLRVKVDKWVEPTLLVTPECVTVEHFQYSYTDVTSRVNDITVSFLNPDLGFVEDRRNVNDPELIRKNGRIPFDFVAVGCTNEDEAIRRAMWRMLTANLETCLVSFTTARMGQALEPYEIIWLADPNMGWSLQTGRIEKYQAPYLYTRDLLQFDPTTPLTLKIQSYLGLVTADVFVASRGDNRLSFVGEPPAELLQYLVPEAQFALLDGDHKLMPFRVLAVEAAETGGSELMKVSCSQVSIDKYNHPLLVINNTRIINITSDQFNYNLYNEYFARFGVPYLGLNVEFRILGDVLISSTSVSTPGLDTGVWPEGVVPKVVVGQGIITGRGGRGAEGGSAYIHVRPASTNFIAYMAWGTSQRALERACGQDGGLAIRARSPVVIDLSTHPLGKVFGATGGGASTGGVAWTVGQTGGYLPGAGGGGGWPYGEGGRAGRLTQAELLEVGTTFSYVGDDASNVPFPGSYGSPGTRLTPGEGGVAQEVSVTAGFTPKPILRSLAGGAGGSKIGLGTGGVPVNNGEGSIYFPPGFGFYFSYYGGATAGKRGQAATGGRFITWVGSNPINTKGNIAA